MNCTVQRGDRVIIKRQDITGLKHRKRPVTGLVTSVNGAYIYVRPSWCTWETELYPSEVEIYKLVKI